MECRYLTGKTTKKKSPRRKQPVPKRSWPEPQLNSERMFWCFLSVEKGEAFPSGFDDSATPSKYLGQFEGSSQLELKSNSPSKRHCASGKLANNPCFGSGSSHLSGTDCGKGFSLQLLTRCSGQHSGNRAVQRCGV